MATYSIKDLETLTGIKAHTIRIWEKRYNLVTPLRTDSNIRYYDDEDLKRLLNISILHRYGIKISRIAELSNSELGEKILQLSRQENDYETQIESLVVAMIELDEYKFEKILTTSIIRFGFEDTIFKILYPLFEKIGLLWQTGTINPAQEHFISNLIKQKLMVAIDSIPVPRQFDNSQKIFFLFLPEWELHELGLLIYYYFIKKNNHRVIYLGQAVPEKDIDRVADIIKPDFLITSFTSFTSKDKILNLLNSLQTRYQQKQILVTGIQLIDIQKQIPEKITLLPDANAFRDFVNNIS